LRDTGTIPENERDLNQILNLTMMDKMVHKP